ncbi:MAG TPA: ATP-binding protein [Candidatus Acidoferrum sp.]|jgi:signal transduction histidine kinase|nr:ATP-binding protein [Candidatus Acidoferrum sp.]
MKKATKRKTKSPPIFEEEYRSAFVEYTQHGGEAALGRAYELGRRAISEKKSLMEIASLHHLALYGMLTDAPGAARHQKLLAAAAEFLAETLSPYEMAHRGVQDAIVALRQLNETLEEEIKRIAYAVHDEAGQLLVAVHLALADVARELPELQKERVERIEELLNQVEKQLRRYSHELRPTVLDDLGWIPAIRFLAEGVSKRANFSIQIKTRVAGRLPGPIEIALYRIVQEALTNAAKHSKASRVCIRIGRKNRLFCCSIEDDGVGFDVRAVQSDGKRRGLGLTGMQERLNGIGGTLSIDSARGRGTRLLIELPTEATNANSHRTSR